MRRLLLLLPIAALLAACGAPALPTAGGATSAPATATASPTATATAAATASATATPGGYGGGGGGLSFTACGPSHVSSGEPPASDNGPVGSCEAAMILMPQSGGPCTPAGGGTYSSTTNCPLYPALANRLDSHPTSGSGGGADPVCRCQNTWQSATYQVAGPTPDGPTTYVVRVVLQFGPSSSESFDVIVQGVASGSLISDIQCAGMGASTSIMSSPVANCA